MLNKFVKIGLNLLLTIGVIYPAARITDYINLENHKNINLVVDEKNNVDINSTLIELISNQIKKLNNVALDSSYYDFEKDRQEQLDEEFACAVCADDTIKVKKCLKSGAKVNRLITQDSHLPTALNYAIRNCSPEMVSLLLDHGASVSRYNTTHKTTPLILAVSLKKEKIVTMLINRKVDLDEAETDPTGDTALLSAIFENSEKMAYLLLAAGADVNKINKNNISPLNRAVSYNCTNLVQLLLSYNAEITSRVLIAAEHIAIKPEIRKLLESEPARRAASIFKRNEILAAVTQLPKEIIDTISNYVPDSITGQDLSLEHKLKTKIQIMEKLLVDIMGTSSTKDREAIINKLKRKSSEALENSCRAEIVETLQKSTPQKETDIISKLLLANDSVATSSSKQDLKEKDTADDDDNEVFESANKKAKTH